ncbi:MAG: hypothetical protein QOE35_3979 [Actinomycetota bacterium]|jgi:hypothetical protein
MRKFLGFLIVVELLAAGAYFGGPPLDDWLQDRVNPTLQSGPVETEPPSTRVVEVLRPGQTEVTGSLTRLVAKDAAGDAIPAPFTVEANERGVTRAVIDNVLVDRRPSTISWDGGRPLPISGEGGLDLGSAQLTADGTGLAWALEGSPRALSPGNYRANFTVAVGSGGVASVREGVAFTATADTALDVTKGGAFIRLPAQPLHIRAAASTTAVLDGTFTVKTADGSRPARHVAFGPGLYDITLTPTGTTYTVKAILQGPVS